jgi:hypothetical protein
MPPNPEPLIEVLDGVVPPHLLAAAWAICCGQNWAFGHGSATGDQTAFWKMNLDGDAAFDAIWKQLQPRCEQLAGAPLEVLRQYANGHTYGLGGGIHSDEKSPGNYTLLFYPNPEWKLDWEGETVFYDAHGEIDIAVRPKPNRAVFFDGRIPHVGRAPSRRYRGLRVTVAYKLRAAGGGRAVPLPVAVAEKPAEVQIQESGRQGAGRDFKVTVLESAVKAEAERELERIGQNVRLPGYRAGNIPRQVLEERYGERARLEALKRISARIVERGLPAHCAAASCELSGGRESGDLELSIQATYFPDLPDLDCGTVRLEKLVAEGNEAAVESRQRWKSQLFDQLDILYPIPMFPGLVTREFATIWEAVNAGGGIAAGERSAAEVELRKIAERRLRLGMIITELARRYEIQAASGAELEDQVADYIFERAQVTERRVPAEELREL